MANMIKFPEKLPKEWIEAIERDGRVGSEIHGLKVVGKDKRGTIVHLSKDSFKILHNGKNQNVFGNPNLPVWKDVTVTVAPDGKSFTVDNNDGLVWTFYHGKDKYPSISQNGVQIVKDELWMLQVYDGSWKDIGSSVDVSYEQVTPYNVRVTQSYTSKNGDYNVTWDFYGGFRPKISFVADIKVAGNYRVDWRTYVYKDYAENMTNYVRFWNSGEEAVAFDYSDVYEAFGDITSVEGIDGWVKGKRFDLIFNVGSLGVGVFRLDPNFGYETIGSTFAFNYPDVLVGSVFTAPSDVGTATSISGYIRNRGSTMHVKAVLVLASDLTIVPNGIGSVVTVGGAYDWGWRTSTFATPPTLTPGADYVLMFIGDSSWDFAGDALTSGSRSDSTNSYSSPTDPTDASTTNYKYSVYCTYTAAAVKKAKPSSIIPLMRGMDLG